MTRTRAKGTPEQRFWAKVDKRGPDDCWPWLAYICKHTGYGRFTIKFPLIIGAHRFSFELANGYEAKGMVLHSCDNRSCVNPAHLSDGSYADNMADMAAKGRAGHRGERAWNAVLSEADVIQIRETCAHPTDRRALANSYSISINHLNSIAAGKFWHHVGGPRTIRSKMIEENIEVIRRLEAGERCVDIASAVGVSIGYVRQRHKRLHDLTSHLQYD